ncbi:unnamed protein product [Miscanthus lutarioriparius]|uniref:Protein FAR1-RELATED SEQUENCE n=1 Tax=Miscanthus lutarioriparius TaxID=422564 RepID=A0A811MPI8_9POAL|nr:unnamed protein product [Miscanthus lutarioriparius]
MAQEDIQDYTKKTMELLGKMKEEDPDLEVRFKMDDEGRIESMIGFCSLTNRACNPDQCQGMAAAIKTTLKGTRHRWCRWHVLRKANQKIGTPYSKKSAFKKKFNRLITDEILPSAFEKKWQELVKEYKLEGNNFMNRVYKMRGLWAKPYFMDIFCAGMTSTQRSESANHMLKRFIQRSAPMHIFISKFRDFQFDRNQEEEREIHLTKQMSRRRRVGVPIERHAEAIYTREMHERFYNELYESGAYTIVDKSVNGIENIKCSCGLYEHAGLPCRHSLKGVQVNDIMLCTFLLVIAVLTEIPKGSIHQRWTKEAGPDINAGSGCSVMEQITAQSDELKRRVLVMKTLELSLTKGSINDEAYSDALRAMESIVPVRQASIETINSAANDETSNVPRLMS